MGLGGPPEARVAAATVVISGTVRSKQECPVLGARDAVRLGAVLGAALGFSSYTGFRRVGSCKERMFRRPDGRVFDTVLLQPIDGMAPPLFGAPLLQDPILAEADVAATGTVTATPSSLTPILRLSRHTFRTPPAYSGGEKR